MTMSEAQNLPISAEIAAAAGYSENVKQRLRALPAANIGDAMKRLYVLESELTPVWRGARVVGPAFTVLTAGGDNEYLHKAIAAAAPGDVIVVDGQAATHRALIGELMAGRAQAKGIAGIVIDGAIRDAHDIGAMGMPMWARAETPAGPYRNGPGHLQREVSAGRVVIRPGDIIVGDDDGVVVIRLEELDEILTGAEAKFASEAEIRAAIGTVSA
jgi:regulator of RNase E activity RraA